ncbi:hypothetical protein, partial [Cloacibacillus evryensis]|uniref:hypothetical protein n=1 Tax=Cloacibacillus evryensis TaxID=508460 RepID=UPI0026DFE0DF
MIHNSIVFIIRWFNAIPMPPGCEPDLRDGTPRTAPLRIRSSAGFNSRDGRRNPGIERRQVDAR